MHEPTRRRRKDAVANRERILDGAERLMVSDGIDVSLHRIAHDLGIGIGTVYRHFPTHDDLVLSLYERHLERVDVIGGRLLTITDPWERILAYFDGMVSIVLSQPIGLVVAARVQARFPERVQVSAWASVGADLVAEAKAAGQLRPDVEMSDVAILPTLLVEFASVPEPMRGVVVARTRALLLDAIRPVGADRPALPLSPLAAEQLSEFAHRQRLDGDHSTAAQIT